MNKTDMKLMNNIIDAIENNRKLYLKKVNEVNDTVIKHVFYRIQNDTISYFYHIRYTYDNRGRLKKIKDYPVISVKGSNDDEINNCIVKISYKIIEYIRRHGYNVSCSKEV